MLRRFGPGMRPQSNSRPRARLPIPMKAGLPARCDYEYERNGVANLFMMFAPLEGWRHVKVKDRHTAVDYTHALKDPADAHFAAASVIVYPRRREAPTAKLLRGIPGRGSPAADRALRIALYGKTALAQSGGVGTRRPIVPMPRSPHLRQTNPRGSRRFVSISASPITPRPIGTTPDARIKLQHLYPSI